MNTYTVWIAVRTHGKELIVDYKIEAESKEQAEAKARLLLFRSTECNVWDLGVEQ